MQLLHRHYYIIYEEVRGLRLAIGIGATEEECYRLALISCEIGGNIEALLYPVIGHVRITALLQYVDHSPITILELAAEGIQALFGHFIRIGVPPVGHSDFSIVRGNRETLPDVIIATCVAT